MGVQVLLVAGIVLASITLVYGVSAGVLPAAAVVTALIYVLARAVLRIPGEDPGGGT